MLTFYVIKHQNYVEHILRNIKREHNIEGEVTLQEIQKICSGRKGDIVGTSYYSSEYFSEDNIIWTDPFMFFLS